MAPLKKHEKSPARHGKPGRKPAATSLHAARVRKERALAGLRELELERKRTTLLEAAAVEREWASILRAVRASVLAVVSRIRAQLPHLSTHDAQVIDREVRAALTALGTNADA